MIKRKIYILSSENNGEKVFKIGYTKNKVEDRVKQLKTGNSNDISIEYILGESYFSHKIEAYLHKMLESKKVDGEWFILSSEDIDKCKEIFNKLDESYQFLNKSNEFFKYK